jgi:hypothetical protein
MRIQAFAIGLALAWAAIGGASATEEVLFTITGGDRTATFELPLNPTPNLAIPVFFRISSVPAVIAGRPVTLTDLDFFSDEFGPGGFVDNSVFDFFGPQFYNGPESDPTFVPGVYKRLFNRFTGKTDTVTVTLVGPPDPPNPPNPPNPPDAGDPPAVPAAPELSTWAMLLLGFVGLSYAGYYRKARTSTTLAA